MKHRRITRYLITVALMVAMLVPQSAFAATWSSTDQYSFANSSSAFKSGEYTMTDSDYDKLCDYIRDYYNTSAANSIINKITARRSATWQGSCYGMAVTALLQKSGQISFIKDFDSGKASMYKVSAPYKNSAVQSAINYYYMTQCLPAVRDTAYYSSNWSSALKTLVEQANGTPMLFTFSSSAGGHTIVLTGTVTTTKKGIHKISAYDNKYPSASKNNEIFVLISSDYSTCTVGESTDEGLKATSVEYKSMSDMSAFDIVDIDGSSNNISATISHSGNGTHSLSGTSVSVSNNANTTIKNASNKTLHIKDGVILSDSTMKYSKSYLDVKEGDSELVVEVADSDSFTVKSNSKKLKASVMSNSYFESVELTGKADSVSFSQKQVEIVGKKVTYKVYKSLSSNGAKLNTINGVAQGTALLSDANMDKPSIKSLTVGKKCLTVNISGNSALSAAGGKYKIGYRAVGTSKWKYVTSKAETKKITGLNTGKKYQVRVCNYVKIYGITYTNLWSKVKTSAKIS